MKRSIALFLTVGLSVVTVAGVAVVSQGQPTTLGPADLVLRNGRIVTMDERIPEAQALAATGGKIVAIGPNAAIARYIGPQTKVIDLQGQLAIPGFIEGHGHFTGIGENRINLDLMGTKSWDEIVQMVAQAVEKAKPGQWIVGRGWHQEKWTSVPQPNVEGFPLHASLDKISPNNPVVLTHASGHATFVNAKALELSNITKATANPNGGEILKDASGNPTGLLRETASRLVRTGAGEPTLTPAEAEARGRHVLELADEEVTSKGITSFVDAGSSFDVIDRMRRMVDEGTMNVRLWVMVSNSTAPSFGAGLDSHRMIDYGDGHLTVRAIKMYMDGALGSRGAWLLEPYADKPDSTGLNTTPLATIRAGAQVAIEHNYQVCIHAIGDRANREVLNIYEETFKKNNRNGKDLRWRIEHAQHLSAADIPRFGQMGVIASMQTVHCTSDAGFVPARLGDKRSEEGAYVWQKLLKSGAVVANGTDAPVENVDPIPNYYAAVTRKLPDGRVFYGDQKMSRMEALYSYTMANAFATFEENVKGSLSTGKLADITVLTKDITKVPDEEIKTAKVAYTIIGGKVVYQGK
ncbi:MAG TPA: amidohydrolase [Vicinamibacterales bacterium]|nr:amidohydrolase [Vicinamibacterales bacterium]